MPVLLYERIKTQARFKNHSPNAEVIVLFNLALGKP